MAVPAVLLPVLILLVCHSEGGVLRTGGKSKVTIVDCVMRENWASWGGKTLWTPQVGYLPSPGGIFFISDDNGDVCSHCIEKMTCLLVLTRHRLGLCGYYLLIRLSGSAIQGLYACAGAIYAADNSSVLVRDSELTDNYVKDYDNSADGGACYLWNSAELHLHNTSVHNNIAQNVGGGIAMGTSR